MIHLKKIFLLCAFAVIASLTNAQNVFLQESFENGGAQPTGWTSTNTSSIASHHWFINSRVQGDSTYCDTARRFVGDTLYLTSPVFSTMGATFVTIEFDHICNISGFDTARLQVRDGSGPWITVSREKYYEGPTVANGGAFWGSSGKSQGFNQLTYVPKWLTAPPTPDNTWWRTETFNISDFIPNTPNAQIRFALEGASTGGTTTRAWYVDRINVVGDSCETIKPIGGQIAPFIPNNSIQFSLGPYRLKGSFQDPNSGIDTVMIYYKVNNLAWDSVGMVNIGGNDWQGFIPKLYNGVDTFVAGDSVCYIITAYDKSIPCRNSLSVPTPQTDSCYKFYISGGELIPYCDNFDVNNFWTDSSKAPTTAAIWERGTPTGGAHSPPFSWATLLVNNYPNNAEAYLYSPIFDFGNAKTPRITFWQNRNMLTDGDAFQLQYTINASPWATLGVKNDVKGINLNTPNCPSTWYNAVSTANPSWDGNSGGWVKSFYQLPATFNGAGSVQFRFKFSSNANNNAYGVMIDDFCLENPPKVDVSSIDVIAPGDWEDNHRHFVRSAQDQDSIVVIFRNIGTDTLYSVSARYFVDSIGGPPIVVNETFNYPRTWNGKTKPFMEPLQVDTFKFAAKYVVPHGHYSVRVIPTLPTDADSDNDTVQTKGHFGFITSNITYETDFEEPVPTWATTPLQISECGKPAQLSGTRWELGSPNYGATNSTKSPSNAWDINLTSTYTTNVEEYLYTQFFDLSGWDKAFVSFWQNRNTSSGADGFRIEYNLDRNNPTWRQLQSGVTAGVDEINWFSNNTATKNDDIWSANSSGWIYSEFPIEKLPILIPTGAAASQVQFRFIFFSDGTTTTIEDGVSIDDFRVVNPPLNDMEIVDFIDPVRSCVMDLREPVSIEVKNVGKIGIDSIPVAFRMRRISPSITGWGPGSGPGGWVHDTIFDSLAVGENYDYESFANDSVDMQVFGIYEFEAIVNHVSLDTNQRNDTLKGYTVENVNGCDVEVELTTGPNIPLGSMLYMVDVTNIPFDTIYELPFSSIGPNAVQHSFNICMKDVGNYQFIITPNAPSFISYWNLQDLFEDTAVGTGAGPTGPAGYNFAWQCPPLLSASADKIRVTGLKSKLPIPQDYKIKGFFRNRGALNIRTYESTLDITKVFPVPPAYNLHYVDTQIISSPGMPTLFIDSVTFDTIWSASPGQYNICIWSKDPNGNPDLATFDDTTCLNFVVLDTTSIPYCNDFDGNMNPWGSLSKNKYDTNSTFEKGVPAQSTLNSTSSTPNAWMTGLITNYVVLDSSGIYSPLFQVDDTSICYKISFSHEFKTEKSFDGGVVEYSIDSGLTWTVVGKIADTNTKWSNVNWYNVPYIVGLEGSPHPPGFSGSSQGLISSSYDLKFPDFGLASYRVVFRFRFGADASLNDEGWLIDDFCFDKTGQCIYATCDDGVMNQGETQIDCGGPYCDPCESCNDAKQNQNETGVDCGGVCPPCPSCLDNIKNGLEEKPDCGGPICEPCATCNDGVRNWHWVEVPAPGSGVWERQRETGIDCGGPCPNSCWVGIEDLSANEFGLSQNMPNPTEGKAVIYYSVPNGGKVSIQFRNVLGQTMHQDVIQGNSGINQYEINVEDWADGIYYYSFEYNGEVLIRKMTVNK